MLRRHAWFLKADALRRLGLRNLATVAAYRVTLRLGIHPVQRLRRTTAGRKFFRAPSVTGDMPAPPDHWASEARYFGWHREPLGAGPPDWHRNPFTGERVQGADRPWWKLSDFATGAGDIKTVWEASRFDWVLAFAQRARADDAAALDRLNDWLADWCAHNPAYRGPNWKCGQEASIRVLHLVVAAQWLGQLDAPEGDLLQVVEAHLARIHPTLAYAMAQNNNHGTSEAAALFVGGAWCARQGMGNGSAWAAAGRRWLEDRAVRLIEPDGGFSQYSVNYHRLMLDTLSLAEVGRRWFHLPAFSDRFHQRAKAATVWLREMTDPITGGAPNLGHNDGANLLPLTDADYRDYRPAVQLASALFCDEPAYSDPGPHTDHLQWLGVSSDRSLGSPASLGAAASGRDRTPQSRPEAAPAGPVCAPKPSFHAAGYMVLRKGPWRALFRYPHYRFRPGHCDVLHVDLWHGSNNLLRDAGSFGYNTSPEFTDYFTGPAGHNTVQFDNRDPMPRVSRFLRGAWLETEAVSGPEERDGTLRAAASYRDWLGAEHQRELVLDESGLRIVDEVSGFRSRAVLRWRLAPGDWRIEGNTVSFEMPAAPSSAAQSPMIQHTVNIHASVPIHSLRMVPGWESRYYLDKNALPVLEVEICEPGQLVSEYRLKP